jgi:hypothetical protein
MILPGLPFGLTLSDKFEFVGGTGFITAAGTSSIDLPSGLRPGDLVIVASSADGDFPNYASGYTAGQRRGGDIGIQWCYKIMPNPVDTTATGLSSGNDFAHLAIAFRRVSPTSPLDVASPSLAEASSGSPNSPSITTVTPGSMIVSIGSIDNPVTPGNVLPPAGYTIAAVTSSTNDNAVMAAYFLSSAAGSYDPGAFTSGTSDDWIAATVALRPK